MNVLGISYVCIVLCFVGSLIIGASGIYAAPALIFFWNALVISLGVLFAAMNQGEV